VVRVPCFGALLELATVDEQLNAALGPGAASMPALDLRALLRARGAALADIELGDLWVEGVADAPGILRVRARLETSGSPKGRGSPGSN
jgi:hypothetical protein